MAASEDWKPLEGGCPCSTIRYRLDKSPLIVHCCHCRWCQRETGSAFAVNAAIESKFVTLTSNEKPDITWVPSESGTGQQLARCPSCRYAVWSNYGGSGDNFRFIRTGTLDDPSRTPPNIHIYLQSKVPWLKLDDDLPKMEEFYDRDKVWPKSSLERREELVKSLSS